MARTYKTLFLIVAILALPISQTFAAPINYGDFSDIPPGSVMYLDVTESSAPAPLPLFGPPSITGNNLAFLPKAFAAFATSGANDITDGQLNTQVMVLEINNVVAGGLTSLSVTERGDYTLFGTGTTLTNVAAGVSLHVEILEVDGNPIVPINVSSNASFSNSLTSSGPTVLAPWAISSGVSLGSVLAQNQIPFKFGVTKANIVIDNQLLATSEANSIAFIAKKGFSIRPVIEINPDFVIPEPTTLILGLASLLAVTTIRRQAFA